MLLQLKRIPGDSGAVPEQEGYYKNPKRRRHTETKDECLESLPSRCFGGQYRFDSLGEFNDLPCQLREITA